jgi:hypothetical protein
MTGVLDDLRRGFHARLSAEVLGLRPGSDCLNIADSSSRLSVRLAAGMMQEIGLQPIAIGRSSQAIGAAFQDLVCQYLDDAFAKLSHIRPGSWSFTTTQGIDAYEQYSHLSELQRLAGSHTELRSALSPDYLVVPDIVVLRSPLEDADINARERLVESDGVASRLTPLRASNRERRTPILHASISCKWTMRSDRAQNTRTEALNLIRNRKGQTPHIAVVTLEPMPSRLASIAMGTGDIDCTYHGALDELLRAAESAEAEDAKEMLRILVDGRRLRDISDLPLDLAI